MVVIFVQFPLHVRKMNMLSNSYPFSRTTIPYCSEKEPNQGDSEEVIVVELQVLFRKTKVLSEIVIHVSIHITNVVVGI